MPDRACTGTSKGGTPCRAAPLKDRDVCLAHSDVVTRGSVGFTPEAGHLGGRPRVPRATDLQRELVERYSWAVVRPYFRALGLDLNDDGTVERLKRGAIYVGRDKAGGVHRSTIEDLGAQMRAAEMLLDRVFGRPRQALEHTGAGGGPIELQAGELDLRKLSDSELAQLQALLEAATP
jgi:hypothetical protein